LSFNKRRFRDVKINSDAIPEGSQADWMRYPIDAKEFELAARTVSALTRKGVAADAHVDRRDSVNSHVQTYSIEHDMLQKLMHCYVCADGPWV
jgi:hypothetical protein